MNCRFVLQLILVEPIGTLGVVLQRLNYSNKVSVGRQSFIVLEVGQGVVEEGLNHLSTMLS